MKNKGFSLVELIVVIAIMAILVGVAVPVYTGYISKANEAKDIQLLEEINSAFMTVAIEKQVDFDDLTNINNAIKVDRNTGAITFDLYDEKGIDLNPGVKEILGEELKFNVFTAITYSHVDRCFESGTAITFGDNGGYVVLNKEDVANLKNSTFGTKMTVEQLLDKVNNVTGYAAMIDSDAMELVLDSPEFLSSAAGALDISEDELADKVMDLAEQILAMENLADVYPDIANKTNDYDRTMAAVEQVKANAAVLLAAQNAVNTDAATVTALLGQAGTRDKIIGHLTTDKEEGIALSEAALAYGMYVAYAHHTGNAVEADLEPLEIMTKLEEPGFKEYINGPQGQIDLQGYLSSMQMINSSTESKEAVEKLMVNGFADPDLKGIIEDAANE